MKKVKKGILIAVVLFAVGAVCLDWAGSAVAYEIIFSGRYESYEPLTLYVEDFDGLQRTRYEFTSDRGQTLTGYLYKNGDGQHGIVIIAHGYGGGGHNSYMDCADYFAKNGYYVFAYDATGNDESGGDGVGGLPQGVSDLCSAITFVENEKSIPRLPVVLFGHSWGGYSACGALTYHPEIRAVVECSGFNDSADLIEAEGVRYAGFFACLSLPFVKLHERIKFGKYAENTALDGFASSDAAVLIVHSDDDTVVPAKYGYDKYYELYKDDPRFTFIRLENRGHGYVYCDTAYVDEFNSGFDAWLQTLDYDYKADANKERFAADKAEYMQDLIFKLFRSIISVTDTGMLTRPIYHSASHQCGVYKHRSIAGVVRYARISQILQLVDKLLHFLVRRK